MFSNFHRLENPPAPAPPSGEVSDASSSRGNHNNASNSGSSLGLCSRSSVHDDDTDEACETKRLRAFCQEIALAYKVPVETFEAMIPVSFACIVDLPLLTSLQLDTKSLLVLMMARVLAFRQKEAEDEISETLASSSYTVRDL